MKGMTTIVKTISDWLKVPIFVFGILIILFGDVSPGGGFAGGVILGSLAVLLMLAFGAEEVRKGLSASGALIIGCVGVLLFLATAMSGWLFGSDAFFWNFIYQKWVAAGESHVHFIGSGTIMVAELAIGLAVGGLVFLVIWNLAVTRVDAPGGEREL